MSSTLCRNLKSKDFWKHVMVRLRKNLALATFVDNEIECWSFSIGGTLISGLGFRNCFLGSWWGSSRSTTRSFARDDTRSPSGWM
jgi:hypothetical protein